MIFMSLPILMSIIVTYIIRDHLDDFHAIIYKNQEYHLL